MIILAIATIFLQMFAKALTFHVIYSKILS